MQDSWHIKKIKSDGWSRKKVILGKRSFWLEFISLLAVLAIGSSQLWSGGKSLQNTEGNVILPVFGHTIKAWTSLITGLKCVDKHQIKGIPCREERQTPEFHTLLIVWTTDSKGFLKEN